MKHFLLFLSFFLLSNNVITAQDKSKTWRPHMNASVHYFPRTNNFFGTIGNYTHHSTGLVLRPKILIKDRFTIGIPLHARFTHSPIEEWVSYFSLGLEAGAFLFKDNDFNIQPSLGVYSGNFCGCGVELPNIASLPAIKNSETFSWSWGVELSYPISKENGLFITTEFRAQYFDIGGAYAYWPEPTIGLTWLR